MARYRWQVRQADPQHVQRLMQELNLSRATATVLVARGYTDPSTVYKFLKPSLSDLGDPKLLPDAEPAVRRLALAIQRKEPVLVYGDYDTDGVTATTLWLNTLRKLGVPAEPMIPHRMREGYDLHPNAIPSAQAIGARLVLTCDCGTRAKSVVDALNAHGIEVIITDHHEPDTILPKALAVVNPKRADSRYPYPYLSGVGVSFRLGEALLQALGIPIHNYRRMMLDLVALGTVADVVPLTGENRILVAEGLNALYQTKRVGLQALMQVAGIAQQKPTTYDIGFKLAPRLNAAGRLDDARLALQLLLTEDFTEAVQIAKELNTHNIERQRRQEQAVQEAIAQIESEGLDRHRALVVVSERWHHGIVGLVASKLVGHYSRPAFVATLDPEEGLARASIRSIPAFDLSQLIPLMKPFCYKCGGHAAAGGFSAPLERLDELRQLILDYANQTLTDEDLVPTLTIDVEVQGKEVNGQLLQEMAMLEPFGTENEPPLLLCREVEVLGSRTDRNGRHLFPYLRPPDSSRVSGVLWGGGDYPLEAGALLDVVFVPELDTYGGYDTLRWNIKDFEER